MSDDRALALSTAFDLVEAGKPEEARALLEGLIGDGGDERDNPDAWWIYAHTLSDPVEARSALRRLLELEPDYPGANDLLDELGRQFPDLAPAAVTASLPEDIPLPPSGDEEPDFVQRVDTAPIVQPGMPAIKPLSKTTTAEVPSMSPLPGDSGEAPPRRNLIPLILGAAAVVIVIIAILALLNPPTPPAGEGGDVAVVPTDAGAESAVAGGDSQASPEGVIPATETAEATDASEIAATQAVEAAATEGPRINLTELAMTLSAAQDRATAQATEAPTSLAPVDATAEVTVETALAETSEAGGGEVVVAQVTDVVPEAATPTPESIILAEPTEPAVTSEPVETTQATDVPALLPTVIVIETTPVSEVTEAAETMEPTLELTASVELTPAEQLVQNLSEVAPDLVLAEAVSRVETTSLGETVIVSVCSGYGVQLREDTARAMAALGSSSAGLEAIDAVAVQLTDCASGTAIRIIGTPLEAAQQWAATGDDLPYSLSWVAL